MGKEGKKQSSHITVPSEIINSLSSSSLNSLLIPPPEKTTCSATKRGGGGGGGARRIKSVKLWFFFSLFLFCFLGMLILYYSNLTLYPLAPFILSPNPCSQLEQTPVLDFRRRGGVAVANFAAIAGNDGDNDSESVNHGGSGGGGVAVANFAAIAGNDGDNESESVRHGGSSGGVAVAEFAGNDGDNEIEGVRSGGGGNVSGIEGGAEGRGFWEKPDGLGYRPCLEFSREYAADGAAVRKDRSKYLMVVVSGGMNQQRNQIVDAVVIARILGAALVAPVLQVNVVWGDESEFSDIFDLEQFKRVLADDVRIVSSLPSTHLRTRPFEESQTPFHASPRWIREHYHSRLRRNGVLLLRGLDSRLSKDLPSDLQKLRCKVAFHALKFAPHIQQLGDKIAERMRSKGPYVALHLRMEKDVWIRTGCSPGLSPDYDELVINERKQRPKLLTGKSNMTAHDRKLAGLCPLNALEVARLLKALGAPRSARIYWAGGEPLGGKNALLPLTREYPFFYNKEDLALSGELQPYANRASFMAAIDYIVCENSDVFMPSHGGNMGHALQGHRAYAGHKKYITPNKRHMLPYFLNSSLPEAEFNNIVKQLHQDSLGQPEFRTSKPERDVTKYPVPECMCNTTDINSS